MTSRVFEWTDPSDLPQAPDMSKALGQLAKLEQRHAEFLPDDDRSPLRHKAGAV